MDAAIEACKPLAQYSQTSPTGTSGGAALDLSERDVHRSVQVTGLPFVRPPYVKDH
jgi:hypothetical protein